MMGLVLFSIAAFQAPPLMVAFAFRSLFLPITSIPIHHLFLLVVGLASSTISPPADSDFSGLEQNFFINLSRFLFKKQTRSQIFYFSAGKSATSWGRSSERQESQVTKNFSGEPEKARPAGGVIVRGKESQSVAKKIPRQTGKIPASWGRSSERREK